MNIRLKTKNCSIFIVSVILILLTVLGTNLTAYAASGADPGGSWSSDSYSGEAYHTGWVGIRVMPVELKETDGEDELFREPNHRYYYETDAIYYTLPESTGTPPTHLWRGMANGEIQTLAITTQHRQINNTAASNVFLSWISQGASISSIGDDLNSRFFDDIMQDEAKKDAFWEGYKAEWVRSRPDETSAAEFERWVQMADAGELGILVDLVYGFGYPLGGGNYWNMCMSAARYFQMHAVVTGGQYITDTIGVNTEQLYIKAVNPNFPADGGRPLGCYGFSGCTNEICASWGHIRYGLGIPIGVNAPRIYPYPKDNESYKETARTNFWSWGFFQVAPSSKPKIKLIETHVYKMDGIEVDREIVHNESYVDKQTFVNTPSPKGPCRKTTDTKSKHGQTYEFVEYRYDTKKRDPITDNDLDPSIDDGTSGSPEICVDVGKLRPEDSYTIYVEAEYNCEPEYINSTPAPNVIEEWELSKFFQKFPMFRSDGQYLRSNITSSAGIHYTCTGHTRYNSVTQRNETKYCRRAKATSGKSSSGITYTWGSLSAGMEIVKNGSENYKWTSKPFTASKLGAQTQYDVRPSAQSGYGHSDDDRNSLWVSKTRIGELINMAQWKNSVPSALSRYFDADYFPKSGTVPNYKMPNAGSRLKNSTDTITANQASVAADTWAKNQVSGPYGHTSYVDSYTFTGTGVSYSPVTISFKRYNPIANEELDVGQNADMYADTPKSSNNDIWFSTQLPRTISRSGFGSGYKNTLDNRPVVRVQTEVDMTYDNRGAVEPSPTTAALEANRHDVIVVGDVPRYIRPVSYHGIKIDSLRNPKVSSSTIVTDSRANSLIAQYTDWGNAHRPVIYSGGDLNIGIDQRSLLTVTTWALDFSDTTVKSKWGNDFWSAQDIHRRFKENIDFQTNAKVRINGKEMKLIDDNRFNLGGGQATATTTTTEYTITIRGNSWSSSPSLPTGIASKLELDSLVSVFASEKGTSYPTNLNHNIDSGHGWYTEDSTVLKVVCIVDIITLPNVMFSEKIPITMGPPSPANYNQMFSKGYAGKIDWEFILNSVGTSLSPFSPDGGGLTVVSYARTNSNATEFVISDANVLDARQGGRN